MASPTVRGFCRYRQNPLLHAACEQGPCLSHHHGMPGHRIGAQQTAVDCVDHQDVRGHWAERICMDHSVGLAQLMISFLAPWLPREAGSWAACTHPGPRLCLHTPRTRVLPVRLDLKPAYQRHPTSGDCGVSHALPDLRTRSEPWGPPLAFSSLAETSSLFFDPSQVWGLILGAHGFDKFPL